MTPKSKAKRPITKKANNNAVSGPGSASDLAVLDGDFTQQSPLKTSSEDWKTSEADSEWASAASESVKFINYTSSTDGNDLKAPAQALDDWGAPMPAQLSASTLQNEGWGVTAQANDSWDVSANASEETDNDWLNLPELPDIAELQIKNYEMNPTLRDSDYNRLQGPWESKDIYLRTHYKLLREDAVRPLRDAFSQVMAMKEIKEDERHATIGIYDNVRVVGVTFSPRGIAVRVAFTLKCVGKNILWKQSKRLLSGSMVLLMPKGDAKKGEAPKPLIVATVAARPLAGLEQQPPEIDLFFARPEDIELDSQCEWFMIEERSGYFEAERHTLLALQSMSHERFPLSEYLVDLQPDIKSPPYVQRIYESLNKSLPSMDTSQVDATARILTKSLAIVQGPPGTGKTYVSVQALKLMLEDTSPKDPPIILTCQTNHALDQLLRHVFEFQPALVRLGGRSQDAVIRKRTLFEVREASPKTPGNYKRRGAIVMRSLTKSMSALLEPLKKEAEIMDHNLLLKLNLLNEAQCLSLEKNDEGWVRHGDADTAPNPLKSWLGRNVAKVKLRSAPVDFGFEYEVVDLGFEEVKEQDAEGVLGEDDDNLEALKGDFVNIGDTWTASGSEGLPETSIEAQLKTKDLTKVKPALRGAIYRYLSKKAKAAILETFRKEAAEYARAVKDRKHENWDVDVALLKDMKIIGLTTTGFSKYRGLLTRLAPKVVLIEEAGETLEAPVVAACIESLEHLVLVGDHKQLRPHCHVSRLEGPPWNMNVSLFERLVMNEMEFSLLQRQRRMIPSIRRLLQPIYGDVISDHPAVLDVENRPPVPGMDQTSTWFWTHDYPEQRDEQMSSYNVEEAEMIAGTVLYLILNGVKASEITILTFYNGQRRKINSTLRNNVNLAGRLTGIKTPTVDSYQGEENAFVLLSLVRSNSDGKIGFLSVDNRVCVALSRAQRGFYIFGNAQLLASQSGTWAAVIDIMRGGTPDEDGIEFPCRIGDRLPLYCTKHERQSWIAGPEEWSDNVGGCDVLCHETLPCGHVCPLRCHTFPHDQYICRERCTRSLPCGHACTKVCGEGPCACARCTSKGRNILTVSSTNPPASDTRSASSEWINYSRSGGAAVDDALATHRARDESKREILMRLDEENHRMLFEEVEDDDADLAFGLMDVIIAAPAAALPALTATPVRGLAASESALISIDDGLILTPASAERVLISTDDGRRRAVWQHGAAAPPQPIGGVESEWVPLKPERSLLD